MKRENIKKMTIKQDKLSAQLLKDYRHYCALAFRLEELHQLLDKRHHELTILRDNLEAKFIEQSRRHYREERRLYQSSEHHGDTHSAFNLDRNDGFFNW